MGIDEVPAPALDQDDWWSGKWAGGEVLPVTHQVSGSFKARILNTKIFK